MRVLVVGSGGREHAICWKIKQSPKVKEIFCAPGNGGIASIARCVDIKADDVAGLVSFAKKEKIGLTVVGPEAALVAGIVDEFEKNSLRIFGPNKKSAVLEGSKVYTKELLASLKVPTADFKVFTDINKAKKYVSEKSTPLVVKADGLAAGKGVIICKTKDEASSALDKIMQEKAFGASGDTVIIEDCLEGEEASIIVLSDGKNVIPLASSQDHKRVFDNDEGPNTGGMGAYSPAPVVENKTFAECMDKIIYPVITALSKKGNPYKGVLYAGIMVTADGPSVLEFNVRFGDPETQAILPRLKSDLVDLLEASIDGTLKNTKAEWDSRACVCIVAASGGYPGAYEKGKEIRGIDKPEDKDTVVFHAGTKLKGNKILTSGGRVLGITALGSTIDEAVSKAYKRAEKINFDKIHYRKDIGRRALCRKEIHK